MDHIQLLKLKIKENGYYYKFAITKLYAYLFVYNFSVKQALQSQYYNLFERYSPGGSTQISARGG